MSVSMRAKSRPAVKPTRHAPRPPAPFGQGILPAIHWSGSYGYIPGQDDAAWAAQSFAGDLEPDGDGGFPSEEIIQAGVRWDELYATAVAEGTAECVACGRKDDFIDETTGLCPPCEIAAESASQQSRYAGAGLGWIDP